MRELSLMSFEATIMSLEVSLFNYYPNLFHNFFPSIDYSAKFPLSNLTPLGYYLASIRAKAMQIKLGIPD